MLSNAHFYFFCFFPLNSFLKKPFFFTFFMYFASSFLISEVVISKWRSRTLSSSIASFGLREVRLWSGEWRLFKKLFEEFQEDRLEVLDVGSKRVLVGPAIHFLYFRLEYLDLVNEFLLNVLLVLDLCC